MNSSTPPDWMRLAADDATADMMSQFAALFAAFYHGLRRSGLSAAEAVPLTQTYIASTVAATTQRPAARGESS